MTVVKHGSLVQITCDGKGCEETSQRKKAASLNILQERLEKLGWTIRKENGHYRHYCSTCSGW